MARATKGILNTTTGPHHMWVVAALLVTLTLASIITVTTAEPESLMNSQLGDASASLEDTGGQFVRKILRRRKRAAIIARDHLFSVTKGYSMMDIVFALERSSNPPNSKQNFVIQQKQFVRMLIRDFLRVKPDATRIAVLTYGTDVRVVIDGVTQQTLSKCDIIGSDYLWEQVRFFDGPMSQGVNLTGVFKIASQILTQGRKQRPNARSALILLTSATHQPHEYTPVPSQHRDWFDTYGVGVTDGVDMRKLSATIANSHTNVYGTMTQWWDTMRNNMEASHVIADVDPEWERYHGAGCSTCVGSGSDCWCNAITGFTRCACQGGYIDQLGDCVQPCLRTVCTHGQFYCRPTFQGISYECKCYTAEPRCNIKRVIDCTRGTCQNGGTCFDGKNQYACVCLQGFWGANCEINENECHYPNICPNNAHCQDDVNSYKCVDSSGRQVPVIVPSPATYFPQPNYTPAPATQAPRIPATPSPSIPATPAPWIPPTPATGTPPTPAPRTPAPPVTIYPNKGVPTPAGPALTSHWTNLPTQKSTTLIPAVGRDGSAVAATSGGFLETLNDDQRLLLTVVPPAGIGFIVLLIGIGTLIYVLRKKSNRNQGDLSGVTETTSIASHNPSLVTFDSKCYTDEGTPGPPKMPKAVEADSKRVSYGEFDDVLYGNEALQRGMEEWYSYILELYHNQGLNRILIIRLDGEKWVLSPGSKLYMDEVEAIFNLLSKKMIQGTFKVQGREFGIVGNTDFVIMAHTFRNSKRAQEILCATKTRQFVIIGTADFSSDGGRCKEKVLELRDHIKVQGL